MQFIDQAAAYSKKSISLEQAIQSGRAKLVLQPGAEKLALCFRPELEIANAFDARIDARLRFFDLSTPAKLDLLIDELLPEFFHLDLLPGLGLAGITYLVTRIIGKVASIYFVSRWMNFSSNIRKYLGLGMLVQAGVAIGLIGLVNDSNPEVGAIVTPMVLATVLIYETVGPPIIRWILFKAGDVPEG